MTTTLKGNQKNTNRLNLELRYNVAEYLEITNNEAFGFESLWSQIGGFAGIFLGFSLLQVPSLLLHGAKALQMLYQNTISKKEARH